MKMMNFSLLTPEEIHAFAIRLLAIIKPLLKIDELLASVYQLLEKAGASLATALGIGRGSEYTSKLVNADGARDRAFVGFRDYVGAITYYPLEKEATAALVLQAVIEARGNQLYSESYAIETSQLNSLLDDLKNPAAREAITLINGSSWLEHLTKTQDNFEAIFQQKIDTEATQELPIITKSKPQLVHYVKKVLDHIDTKAEIDAANFSPLVKQIDEMIVSFMTVARARKTRNSDDNTEPTPTDNINKQ
jgi:hypothetical protein